MSSSCVSFVTRTETLRSLDNSRADTSALEMQTTFPLPSCLLSIIITIKMVLYLIGLGLGNEKDITVRGLEAVRSCQHIFLEAYTSILGTALSWVGYI